MLFIIWKPQLNCDHVSLWETETNASFHNLAVRLSVVLVDSVKCTLLAVSWSFPGGVRYTYCTTYMVYSTVMVIWWYSISKCWLCGLGCNLMPLVSLSLDVYRLPLSALVPLCPWLFLIWSHCYFQGTWLATSFTGRRTWLQAVQPLCSLLKKLFPMRQVLPPSWTGTMWKSSLLKKSMQATLNLSSGKYKPHTLPIESAVRQCWLLSKMTIWENIFIWIRILKVSHCFLFSFFPFHFSSCFISPFPSEFTLGSHRAGTAGDETLANKVFNKFKDYDMNTWTDEHFVKVQDPPASGFNKFVFKNGNEERLDGFLSYSAIGKVTVMNNLN